MFGINYFAVLAATVLAFAFSSMYYLVFGKEMKRLRPEATGDIRTAPTWKKVVEAIRSLTISFVLAHFIVVLGINNWISASFLGIWLWIGFPAPILLGSFLWNNMPWKLAAIHSGDWFGKLILITILLSVWH